LEKRSQEHQKESEIMNRYMESRNPFFNVNREQLQTASGIDIPNKQALINADTGNFLGIVSPGYELVTNKEIDDLFAEAISDLEISNVKDHLDSETKRWKRHIVFNDDRLNFEIEKSDMVGVMLEIHNGFTGRVSFGYSLMGYRWICENGMVMGKKELFCESFAHHVENPEKLRESFGMKFEAFKNNALEWNEWTCTPFNELDFTNFIEHHTKQNSTKAPEKYVTPKVSEAIIGSYEPLMIEHKLNENKWGAFNVLTALATHGTKARKGSNLFSNRYNTVSRLAGDFYNWRI